MQGTRRAGAFGSLQCAVEVVCLAGVLACVFDDFAVACLVPVWLAHWLAFFHCAVFVLFGSYLVLGLDSLRRA